jgi:hypothetical protein
MFAVDRRKDASRVTFEQPLQARLVTCDGAFICECQVIDLSEKEARLKVDGKAALPEEFFLLLSSFGHPVYRRCLRQWTRGTSIGVAFFSARLSLRAC